MHKSGARMTEDTEDYEEDEDYEEFEEEIDD